MDYLIRMLFGLLQTAFQNAKVLSFCELKIIQGFITPVIFSNVYYLLRQTAKHES